MKENNYFQFTKYSVKWSFLISAFFFSSKLKKRRLKNFFHKTSLDLKCFVHKGYHTQSTNHILCKLNLSQKTPQFILGKILEKNLKRNVFFWIYEIRCKMVFFSCTGNLHNFVLLQENKMCSKYFFEKWFRFCSFENKNFSNLV